MGLSSDEGKSAGHPAAEIASLTSLRGFLAVWVVVYHFWNDVVRLFPSAEALSPLAQAGHMAVPAFFMLSGFVLSYNYAPRFRRLRRGEVARFLWLRLGRVYPVHFVTLMTVGVMVLAGRRSGFQLTDSGYGTRDFLLNLILAQTWVPDFQLNWNYPSWSISSEWFAYLLFPALAAGVLNRLTTRTRAVAFAAAAVAGSVAVVRYWRPWPFYELVLVVPTFLAGAAVYGLTRGQIGASRSARRRSAPEVVAVGLVAGCYTPDASEALLTCGFFVLIFALVRLGPACHRLWSIPAAVFIGEISYSLYMTHTLVQKVVYRLLPSFRYEAAEAVVKCGVLAAYAALVVGLCLATYYFIENPFRKWMKRASGRRG